VRALLRLTGSLVVAVPWAAWQTYRRNPHRHTNPSLSHQSSLDGYRGWATMLRANGR
jgi:hypothetical protein